MSEHGPGTRAEEPATDPRVDRARLGSDRLGSDGRVGLDPVARAELRRARRAVFGNEAHPDATLFAVQLAKAVGGPNHLAATTRGAAVEAEAHPGHDPVAGAGPAGEPPADPAVAPPTGGHPRPLRLVDPGTVPPEPLAPSPGPRTIPALQGPSGGPETLPLPAAPALVCDRGDRVVRVNEALLRLTGRTDDAAGGLFGMRLAQFLVGPDVDARLVRADGGLVRVRVVRWDAADQDLQVVVLVDLPVEGSGPPAAEPGRRPDRRWTAEVERLARVGTWSFELATSTLVRSETLTELYRSLGVQPDGPAGPVEGEQVALLCRALRAGTGTHHHVDMRLPGGRRLSCRAEVECAADGTPVRLVGVVRDLTAQHEAETRAHQSVRRFADLVALVPTGLAMIAADGRLIDANPALCALLDVPVEHLRGVPALALAAEPPAPAGTTALDGPLGPQLPGWLRPVPPGAAHGYTVGATPLLRGDGTTVWCEVSASVTVADDGGWFWMVACSDVSDQRRAAELLRSAGTVDELTRLPNRAASLALLDRLLAGPGSERVAVVCGDLDDFRRINSSLGHEAGDDVLLMLAGRLQRELPVGCTAARLTADVFVVVCADHADVGGPDALAHAVAELLAATVTVHGRPVPLTATVGVAVPPAGREVAGADLLRFAEVAMHDAKRCNRGGVAVATEGVVDSACRALELEAELRAAIASDALVLEYQPVVGPDGRVGSAEALVRWPHPERGVIPPSEFLPVAQRCGLLRDLDLWVLRTAAREAASWPAHDGRPISVAVNLAGLLPGDTAFRAEVTRIVEEAGLPWDRLVLELVETCLVDLPAHALAAMDQLVRRGVRFAVDDFGTGYSSLARLKELPAQIIKVDRAFVTGVGSDPADFAVARAVVDMATAMGRSTVAEGVETAEQFHVLRGIGVGAYQGWLFARPLAAWQLRELLVGGRLPTPAAAEG